jgi:LysM repeat protein
MHRDHKLGLALGVLVIGFAGALCFPKQPPGSDVSLELKDAAQLDADIELLPVRAYTEAEARRATPARTAAPTPITAREDVPVAASSGDTESVDLFAGPPEPIRSPPPAEPAPAIVPAASPVPAPTPTVEIPRQVPEFDSPDAEPGVQHYTVRAGDTLSGLAARFLGSSQRYREIFEANREVLATPDDLRVGMVLTIPDRLRPRMATPDAALLISEEPVRLVEVPEPSQDVVPASHRAPPPQVKVNGDTGSGPVESTGSVSGAHARRFRPTKRSPFVPGPTPAPEA